MNTIEEKRKMQEEAVRRLEILEKNGLLPDVRKRFTVSGRAYYSDQLKSPGTEGIIPILYFLDNREWLDKIREVEEEYGILVYHAAHYRAEWGEVLDLLHVDASSEKDWDIERNDLEEGYTSIYAVNLTYPEFGEFGSAQYRPKAGGLLKLC